MIYYKRERNALLNCLFRLLLTLNATFWMIVVYGIKQHWKFACLSEVLTGICLLIIPILLSALSITFSKLFSKDTITKCVECTLADNEFLSIYLGYFFVALSVSDDMTLAFVYVLIFLFTFLTQTQYFNPIFLLFGYHFYHITTVQGTRVLVIAGDKIVRNYKDIHFSNMRRINDTTYIKRKDEER